MPTISVFNPSTLMNPFQSIMHIRPLRMDSRERAPHWLYHILTLEVFKNDPYKRVETTVRKLDAMKYFWIALARSVEPNTRRDVNGVVISGGWQRYDFLGMMDWYRTIFHMPGWWHEPKNEREQELIDRHHCDGVWLTVLLTSPWSHRPEFDDLLGRNKEPLRDAFGRLLIKANGLPAYATNEHESDAQCQNFLDRWMEVANTIMFATELDGSARCGAIWAVRVPR
ncbi:hypothetical protein BGZ63DRAFT_404809 [Mariannaea sp. PMI_226]|nr:hypothetical protein BGZ63DRAFT_404809 [Mariannaea sp. PMI_226]